MIHSINRINVTNEIVLKLNRLAQVAAQRAKNTVTNMAASSREMQMVPKYLEVAMYKGKDRFSSDDIAELTELVRLQNSEIAPTELIKLLLNIGLEKCEPLTTKEIKNFLTTTAFLNEKGQMRVLKFMQQLKENPLKKSSWDKMRDNISGIDKRLPKRFSPEEKEDYLRGRIAAETNLIRYRTCTSLYSLEPLGIDQYINLNNLEFVYGGIAACEKPELLAEITQKFGATPELSYVPNELVSAYELCGKNDYFMYDLIHCFYPAEIKQIVSKLSAGNGKKDLSKYFSSPMNPARGDVKQPDLSKRRSSIIKYLELTNKVKLFHIRRDEGSVKTIEGSFEQGKRQ